MAEPPQRLGRGLAALLGGGPAAPHTTGQEALLDLPVAAIRPNPGQPRRRFDEASLTALTESIQANGLVQPLVVRPLSDGTYELIAGERRWRAAQRAGRERVAALVRDAADRERLELALVENVVREDLNPMELARGVATLVDDFGQTHAAVAATLGRSRAAVSNLIRLLELPDTVQAMVEQGELSEGAARAVLAADGARARRELAERAVAGGWSVRQIEAAARAGRRRDAAPAAPAEPSATVDRAVDALYGLLEAPVTVRRGRGGSIVVQLRFSDEEALRAALARLP